MDPQGISGEDLGGSQILPKYKLYPIKSLLQGFRGPPMELIDTIGVRWYFWLLGVDGAKTTGIEGFLTIKYKTKF